MDQRVARGNWQAGILDAMLLSSDGVENPVANLRGHAASYSKRYALSLDGLINRMHAAGYAVYYKPGSHGGMWTARYSATAPQAKG